MGTESTRHWRRSTDSDGVCWLEFDKSDSSSNTLSSDVLDQLDQEITALSQQALRGLVIKSAKPGGFILGADITEFAALDSLEQATAAAVRGQDLLARVEALNFPTVAAINGFALGGGFELALACDYRIAVDGYERNLGLPEVQLGIHPGFGGTVRTVKLIGAPRALDMMLSGRSFSPREALAVGLIDRVVAADQLDFGAAALISEVPTRQRAAWYLRLLNLAAVRPLIARKIGAQIARRARKEHYPAPYAVLDLWTRYAARGPAAYKAEADSIGRLLLTQTSKNLVRMFLLRERLRNLAPKQSAFKRVHVVGAGVMGGDIASWCALRGFEVSLQDRAMEYVQPALERAQKLFKQRLRAPGAADEANERLTVDLEGARIGSAELVIEAIVENLDAKQALLAEIEPKLNRDALIATNTSSIRLEHMATVLENPGRFIGLHFFNPVARLPLVEVIEGPETDPQALSRALSIVIALGKLPLPCRSAPGFVVNRILTPYLLEALRAHEDGHALETIDAAAKSFGMPTGPIELADRVGLDVALSVARILSDTLGSEPPEALQSMVTDGKLGAKSGQGFYAYSQGRPQKRRDFPKPDVELVDRLILALVNEAVACHEDGVVEDWDLLDAGVVFGTGFAPFTGGPINYARQRGVEEVVATLQTLSTKFGERFTPHPGWKKLAAVS